MKFEGEVVNGMSIRAVKIIEDLYFNSNCKSFEEFSGTESDWQQPGN